MEHFFVVNAVEFATPKHITLPISIAATSTNVEFGRLMQE